MLAKVVILFCVMTLGGAGARCQIVDSSEWHPAFTPSYLLLPEGLRDGYTLRDYISSAAFKAFRQAHSDREAVDAIWIEALLLTHGNFARASFAATIATSEHEVIPLSVLGLHFRVPFTTESHTAFESRRKILPSYVYIDTVEDTDKLQHFFASAWLKDVFGMHWLASLGGKLVELLEAAMVEGGEEDPRDIHADEDGVHFRESEDEHLDALPSDYFSPNPVTTTARIAR